MVRISIATQKNGKLVDGDLSIFFCLRELWVLFSCVFNPGSETHQLEMLIPWLVGWFGLGWVGDAGFSWKKIRNPGAVGRLSYEFAGTMNARRILPEKRQGIWGSWYSAHFHWKTHESARVGHPWHINLQSRWSPGAFYMRKHKESGGVGGSDI